MAYAAARRLLNLFTRWWTVAALFGLLVGFFGLRGKEQRVPRVGPMVGERLPSMRVTILGEEGELPLTELLTRTGTCSLLVVGSTYCGFCQRMRVTWPGELRSWSEAVGTPVHAVWLMGQNPAVQNAFYDGYDFESITRAWIPSRPGRALRLLGIYGTPTTYLLDRTGRVRQGLMGDRLPAVEEGINACL